MYTYDRDDYAKFKQEVPKGATLIARLNDTADGIRVRHNRNIYEIPQIHLQDAIPAKFLNIRNLGFGANPNSFIKIDNEGNLALCDDRKASDYHFLWKGTFQEINAGAMRSLANKMQVTPESITRKIYPNKISQLLENKPEGEREAIQDKFLDNVENVILKHERDTPINGVDGPLSAVGLTASFGVLTIQLARGMPGEPPHEIATPASLLGVGIIGAMSVPSVHRDLQLKESLDKMIASMHQKVEPSPHVEYLDTSLLQSDLAVHPSTAEGMSGDTPSSFSSRLGSRLVQYFQAQKPLSSTIVSLRSESASTGYEVNPPSNLRRRTPSSELFMENSPKREEIRVIKSAIERGEKRGIAIKNLQIQLDDVETFLTGTSNKSTQTEAQEPGPMHEKAGRRLPLTLREHRALERNIEKSIQALESQVDHLGQFDLNAVKKDLSTKRASAEKKESVDKSTQTQTEAHAESSSSRWRSTSAARLSGLTQAQGGASSPPRDSQRSRSR